jgi:PIN domain nuclease of toxin-antitoxin system
VRLLLDTHVVLWWRTDSARLKPAVRRAIGTTDIVWVSAASGWEIAIKQALGKLRIQDSFAGMVAESDFLELPVTLKHAEQLLDLPAHHTDPFDRMLIAQAHVESATIVTHDRRFELYDIPVLWV